MLETSLAARVPLIVIRPSAREQLERDIAVAADVAGMTVVVVSALHGAREGGVTLCSEGSVESATEALAKHLRGRGDRVLWLTDERGLESDSAATRRVFELVVMAQRQSSSIVIAATCGLWAPLQALGITLEQPFPTIEDIRDKLSRLVTLQKTVTAASTVLDGTASALVGLTETESINLMSIVLAGDAPPERWPREVARLKTLLVSRVAGLEVIPPDASRVVGLDLLTSYLTRQRRFFEAPSVRLKPPRGILVMGTPGCGKSATARHVASEWGLPLYRLDLAAVHGRFLGESEERLRAALSCVERSTPCVLWVDEVEKGVAGAGSDGDSGATARLVGHLLFWLQETTARVYTVLTSNDVDRIPPELLRRGRLDATFFVDLPGPKARCALVQHFSARFGVDFGGIVDAVAERCCFMSGADIESFVLDIARLQLERPGCVEEHLETALDQARPFGRQFPELIERLRAWGRTRARPAATVEPTL